MMVQTDENGEFCKEDANKVFLTLRSVLSCEEEARRLPRGIVLFLLRMSKGSEVFPTSGDYLAVAWRTLYRLVTVSVHQVTTDEAGISLPFALDAQVEMPHPCGLVLH